MKFVASCTLKYSVSILTSACLLLAASFYYIPTYTQMCGETPIYFVKFGLYGCDQNDEAAVDFSCYGKYGSFNDALKFRYLTEAECRDNYDPKYSFGLDYLETIERFTW
jgi:hypothetical protein